MAAKGFGDPVKQQRPKPQPSEGVEACKCESGKAYKNCCEKYHLGKESAPTPEATLRARFVAFGKGNLEYLLKSTHPDYHTYHYNKPAGTAGEQLAADLTAGINKFEYAGLKIVQVEPGVNEDEGFVSYEYLSRKKPIGAIPNTQGWGKTAEKNRFLKSSGEWQFVDYQRASFNADMPGMQAELVAEPKKAGAA